jgi:hypothetical protein
MQVARVGLVGLALLGACGTASVPDPSPAVARFYATYLSSGVTGVPDSARLAALAPFLSDTLRALLAGAARLRDEAARRVPDEKPPFADGDPFSSLFEGPTGAAIEGRDSAGGVQRVVVRLTYHHADPVTRWTDTAVVVRKRDRWVIDDIRYGGAWDFASRGALRSSLEGALAAPAPGAP